MIRQLMVCCAIAVGVALFSASDAMAEETTYYAGEYCGGITASGDYLDCSAPVAAHPYLPFGTVLTVCHEGCATVTVVDRGPNLDLSPAAAQVAGILSAGRVDVPMTVHDSSAQDLEIPLSADQSLAVAGQAHAYADSTDATTPDPPAPLWQEWQAPLYTTL